MTPLWRKTGPVLFSRADTARERNPLRDDPARDATPGAFMRKALEGGRPAGAGSPAARAPGRTRRPRTSGPRSRRNGGVRLFGRPGRVPPVPRGSACPLMPSPVIDCAFERCRPVVILSATTPESRLQRWPQREGSMTSDALPQAISRGPAIDPSACDPSLMSRFRCGRPQDDGGWLGLGIHSHQPEVVSGRAPGRKSRQKRNGRPTHLRRAAVRCKG